MGLIVHPYVYCLPHTFTSLISDFFFLYICLFVHPYMYCTPHAITPFIYMYFIFLYTGLIAHPYVYCPPYKEEDDAWGLLFLLGLVLILGEKFATDGTNLVNDIAKTTATTLIGTPGPISILLPPILFN